MKLIFKSVALISVFALLLSIFAAVGLTAHAETYYGDSGKYRVFIFDESGAADPAVCNEIVTIFTTVYPQMADRFNKNAPDYIRCYIDPNYDGVAYTTKDKDGTIVVFSADWFKRNPADTDCATHEFMHCVQDYRFGTAMWLVEGIADYARNEYGLYNDKSYWSLPSFSADHNYDNSYRITARFLLWLDKYIAPGIVDAMDDYLYNGQYSDSCWETVTGRTVEELWQLYSENPSVSMTVDDYNTIIAQDAVAAIGALPESISSLDETDNIAAVESARAEVDALSNSQKVFVSNISKLEKLENDIIELKKPKPVYSKGDVDKNGEINVSDILMLKNLIMTDGWNDEQLYLGDMDESGSLNVGDIIAVKNLIMAS